MTPKILDKCYNWTYSTELAAVGLNPYFHEVQASHGPEVMLDGRKMVMIGSNNYLGLASDPRVHEAAKKAIDEYGTSLTGSRFLNGSCLLHYQLEEELADFLGKESALIFTTGMQANQGAISCLLDRRTVAFIDKLDHASIYDGVRLGRGEMVRFNHNDMGDLESAIRHVADPEFVNTKHPTIIVDGVFSMEGDIALLDQITRLKRENNACLIVDDAHAVGTIGQTGRGSGEYHDCNDDIDIVVGTFSKSLASIGGFAAGPKEVMEYMRYHARSMIFSCGLPPGNTAAALMALRILRSSPDRVGMASRAANRMRTGLASLGYEVTGHPAVPIVSVVIGDDQRVCSLWADLCRRGVYTNVVLGQATTPGRQLIRTSFMACHENHHIDFVLEQFAEAGKQLGLINGQRSVEFGNVAVTIEES